MSQEPTIEVYVRSLSSSETGVQLDSIIDRLEALQREDSIADYDIHVWGERISTSPAVATTDAGAFIRNRVIEFREWAAKEEVTLPSGFDTHTSHSAITGETHEYITLPTLVLAERTDEGLASVAPHATKGSVTTVTDRLGDLADDAVVIDSSGAMASVTDD